MAYRLSTRHQEVDWREFTLWSILFFGVYLFYPFSFLVGDRSYVPLPYFPYLPNAITIRLITVTPLILTNFIVVYMSERYLLLSKVERPTALLFITALTLTQPELTFLRGSSLLLMTLILFTSFGEEGRSEAPFPYFTTGLMIGILCLVHPIYFLVVLSVMATQYLVRTITLRNVLAVLLGLTLPAWILSPLLFVLWYQGGLDAYLIYVWGLIEGLVPIQFPFISGISIAYALFIVSLFALGSLLYMGRYQREKVRSRGMIVSLQVSCLFFFTFIAIFSSCTPELLVIAITPLSLLLAKGLGELRPRPARIVRSVFLLILLGMTLAQAYYTTFS